MSAVSSYLIISYRLLSIHLRLGRPLLLFPVRPCLSFFLIGFLLLFSWYVRTNLIVSDSRMLIFGTLWHPLVSSGFWHGPFWSYPLSTVAFSFLLHAICSRLSFRAYGHHYERQSGLTSSPWSWRKSPHFQSTLSTEIVKHSTSVP